ncbi:hydroxyacylglutathione hydrolase [Psychromonas sp. MME2]|uniref:hydroxyacylglutathione hydrolase n=1 Tax=unclassified Psychromonas TaxID=2614957 RepID=UPI00339BE4BD
MINILTIQAFNDNYIWLIKDSQSPHCIVVDPGDAQPVLEILAAQQLIVDAILITHHHHDHIGGVKQIVATSDSEVLLYSKAALFDQSILVSQGSSLTFFEGRLTLSVMEVPGHTLDHVAYYNESLLFCGDTLFSGGCGRVFEGTHEQMLDSLMRLLELNDETKVYCAHEYTQSNLIFALQVEPKNKELLNYIQQVSKLRQQGVPTIPTTIAREKAINPFLRCQEPSLINGLQNCLHMELNDPLATFRALRQYKDRY